MIYAKRGDNGTVISLSSSRSEAEQRPATEADVIQFLSQEDDSGTYKALLNMLDSGIIRVLDDLIELLVTKNIILYTDLPEEAQHKLHARKTIRQKMSAGDQLTVDDIL